MEVCTEGPGLPRELSGMPRHCWTWELKQLLSPGHLCPDTGSLTSDTSEGERNTCLSSFQPHLHLENVLFHLQVENICPEGVWV